MRHEGTDYRLPMLHDSIFNIYNELAAVAVMHEMGLPMDAVAAALDGAGLTPELSVAPRDTVGPCHIVRRRALCKR